MGRALAWVAVAIVFGASAWLLVMGVLTALLHSLGLSWLASFAICAALSLGVTGFAAWRVSVFFDHAGMHATRRQLARFGIGDENDDDEAGDETRSEEHTSELQALMRISYAVFCLKKKTQNKKKTLTLDISRGR